MGMNTQLPNQLPVLFTGAVTLFTGTCHAVKAEPNTECGGFLPHGRRKAAVTGPTASLHPSA